MALDLLFSNFTTDLDAQWVGGVSEAVQGALSYIHTPLQAALQLYVIITACAVIIGEASANSFVTAAVRAVVIVGVLQSAQFTPWIQEAFLTTIPNELASALHGQTVASGAARQFDVLRDTLQNVAATILEMMPGLIHSVQRGLIHLVGGIGTLFIAIMYIFWYAPRILIGIVIPLGPFLIPLYLFRATRHFADAYAAKLISLTALQLAGSILVKFLIVAITHRIAAMRSNPGIEVDQMSWNYFGMVTVIGFGAILMFILPRAIAIGSGIGSSSVTLITTTVNAVTAPVRGALGLARLGR